MASPRWSNLPPYILSIVAKILNTDVDILRLRSVCSTWRSFVRPRLRPSPFPLKVPPLPSDRTPPDLPSGGDYYLNYTTLYRISPPKHGPHAGDPSEGWLIRVLEVNPNHFILSSPLPSKTDEFPRGTIPKYFNFLDYRITEVCKCYSLDFIACKGSGGYLDYLIKKVIVVRNYAVDCEFAVIVLYSDRLISYWKYGDKAWTPIDANFMNITDVILYKGTCYALGRQGILASFDFKFIPRLVPISRLPCTYLLSENSLVECKSDLYAVTKVRVNTNDESTTGILLHVKVFKKCNNSWKHIRCLGNDMLLSSDDVSVGLSTEDFRGMGGNCVYVAYTDFYGKGLHYGVFHLDADTSSALKLVQGRTFYWSPPTWLKKFAQDS